jgi:HPt (histidine-containing phosphotransfer) domain-containing protein
VRQLNLILNRFVRNRYPIEVVEEARRKDMIFSRKPSTEQVCALSMEPVAIEAFIRDAQRSIEVLEAINAKSAPWSDGDKTEYEIYMHGMKSALSNIRRFELSSFAKKLEKAGYDDSAESLREDTARFIDSLRAEIKDLMKNDSVTSADPVCEDLLYFRRELLVIKKACDDYDVNTMNSIVRQLRKRSWPEQESSLLVVLDRHLLISNFDEIKDALDEYFDFSQK